MTWPPKTWVDGDTPSGDNLNDYLRDPMNDLSAHIHDGSAGQGSNEITPDKVTFADQGASPSAAGELQRKGDDLEWYGAAVVAITEVNPDPATAGPRTLGTGGQQAAAGDHTHTLTGDADVGDVKSPKTFYKDDIATRLTGTMPTEAIVAGSDVYAAGYHAGNVGGLDAIDTDLATANIKSGITIFGKAGSTNVRDSSDADAAVGDVKSAKTFYASGGARKTGTLPTVAITGASDAYPTGYHVGHGSGLGAIDSDLAPANIKSGVTIFGKAGTLAVIDDVQGSATSPQKVDTSGTFYSFEVSINASDSYHGVLTAPTFAADSRAFGAGAITAKAGAGNTLKAQLLMGGTQVAESPYITSVVSQPYMVTGSRALSGSQQVLIRVWNYDGAARSCFFYGEDANSPIPVLIATGSMKI